MFKSLAIIIVLAFTGFTAYLTSQIATMQTLVGALEASKTALTIKRNKLAKENSALVKENSVLKKRNKKLVAQKARAKKMVAEHRKKTLKRNMTRASKKMAKASGSMIPFAGITIIAIATADDINNLCADIKETRELELNLYEESTANSPEDIEYCHASVGKEIAATAESARISFVRDFGISYQSLKKQNNEMMVSVGQISDGVLNANYQEEFKRQYDKVVNYWSLKIEDVKTK